MHTFNEFIDKKSREAKKQLGIVKKILEKNNQIVGDHREDEEPHLFLKCPDGRTSFDGVRIYKIADSLAYRIQREEKTHPFGKAYPLDIEDMFSDYMTDTKDQEKAGKAVIKSIVEELNKFFQKSAEAENELKQSEFDKSGDPLGRVTVRTTGTDYANQVQGWTHGTTTN